MATSTTTRRSTRRQRGGQSRKATAGSQNGTPKADAPTFEMPYSLEMIPTDQIFVDPKYQRNLTSMAKRIEADFDENMFIPLLVSERSNGKFAAFDGQHRWESAKNKGYEEIPCLVYRGLTPEQESTLFSRLQRERRNISAADRFRAQLYGERDRPETQMAHDIEAIAERCGFTVGSVKRKDKLPISSPTALESIYKAQRGKVTGPEALMHTLLALKLIWPEESRNTDADLIRGMGLLYLRHADKVDEDQLVSRLRDVTPGIVLGRAHEERTGRGGGGAGYAVYRALVRQYNRGSGKRLLAPRQRSEEQA